VLFLIVGILHLIGWALFAYYVPRVPAMAGMGALAYGLGLRHAFDADHISAIDDTTRLLLRKRRPAFATGFFFSLGHSTIVLLVTIALVLATRSVQEFMPTMERWGGLIGGGFSGIFLLLIGLLNLVVLLEILQIWRMARRGEYQPHRLDELLAERGLMRRIVGGRFEKVIAHGWQLYPVGILFGIGFDTASEIALLALAAGIATQGTPPMAAVSLAILFGAGMSLLDTADGVFMTKAYGWALTNPLRKIYYNLTTTGLSVAVALLVGTIELVQTVASGFNLRGEYLDRVIMLNYDSFGYAIVALFGVAWLIAIVVWKVRRLDDDCLISATYEGVP
jgi:high-affinity nickel-transport protein